MYRNKKVAVIVPAYNEAKLITKTLTTVPSFVDGIFAINDCSKDDTLKKMKAAKRHDKRVIIIDHKENKGLGYSLTNALKLASKQGYERMAIMAGDAQMDPEYLKPMLNDMEERHLDYIKANRFLHFEELKAMPRYRRIGNIIVTILTKFATGYYSIFDTQNGYVIYSKRVVDDMPWHLIGTRYEYENTILIGLSIIDAKVGDYSVPALYGEETSTINLFSTTTKVLRVLFTGFWKRIYYKYVLYNFHPVALFLLGGLTLFTIGAIYGIYLAIDRLVHSVTPTSGTVMLAVLAMILGFQLLLTAFILDVMQEKRD